MEQVKTTADKREHVDRRQFTWKTVFYGFLLSRRRVSRRQAEDTPVFMDWLHPWIFAVAVGTMILSALDAFLTLQLLERGSIELNSVMAALMEQGVAVFAASKLLLTAIGILALVFMARALLFNRMRTGLLLAAFFCIYACLVGYEFVSWLRLT